MSVEVMPVILAAAGLLITLGACFFAGFTWLLRRMDERFDRVHEQFDKVDQRFVKVIERFDKMDERFDMLK